MNRSITIWRLFAALPLLALLTETAGAYDPPVDKAGPLTVRIEGPTEVARSGVALPVEVVLENSGAAEIRGAVRLEVIDQWRAEPAVPQAFRVASGKTASLAFTVTAGERTYSAHYPIHAYAEFEAGGEKLTAHPILILETKLPPTVRTAAALPYEPISMAPDSELALWRVETHRTVVAVDGREAKTMPVGWQGSEPESRGSTTLGAETLDGVSRSSIVIHPPWWQGQVGTQWIEYPLILPDATPIRLRFANAMTPTGEGDGVTFRVRVAPWGAPDGTPGEIVFERHTGAKAWSEAEADLDRYAGGTIRLQLESHPGPKNNTAFDRSLWAEPLLVSGRPDEPAAFPPTSDEGSERLGAMEHAGTAYEVRLWPGGRGLLDSVVGLSGGRRAVFFRGFEVKVLGGRIDDARSPILLEEICAEPCDAGKRLRHRFRSRLGTFDLVVHLWVDRGGIQAKFQIENGPQPQPWQVCFLEEVAVGRWSHGVRQVYAGAGNVIREPGDFELRFDGHRLSTSFVGIDFEDGPSLCQASDVPPLMFKVAPAENHYALHAAHDCTLTLIPAESVWEAVKRWRATNRVTASAGVPRIAGRFVFDLWGGRYGESAEQLRRAFRYGLTDAMVVWHNWQRWGYDYRLPDICPPNPRWGTLEEMQDLVAACKEAGVIFAPHDNYIDFYPDADGFSYEQNIAFHQNGEPVKAWINESRNARSYRYRADRIEPFLKPNLRWIGEHLAPTGYFIDVWSSAPPYNYWTADGEFFPAVYTRRVWGELFAWIRDHFGEDAPQISESGHDQLIGWLDGAQTNHLRVGEPMPGDRGWCVWNWKCGEAERTPWFDAAHHDRFILHGAGYGSRYAAGLDDRLHGMTSDDYLSTEVLTGHPAMVSRPFGRDVVRKYWLTADLMRALALRTIENVTYVDGDLRRQYVEWSGGGRVWVNRGESDWAVGETLLPQYGFLAEVPGDAGMVRAGIVRRDGVIVEFAEAPSQSYVNGRQWVDTKLPIRMEVDGVRDLGGRRFELAVRWQVDAPIPQAWTPFLHFRDKSGEIAFQATHAPSVLEPDAEGRFAAKASGSIPEEFKPDEEYELVYGLYHRGSGERLPLAGADVGDRRIRLGSLLLQGEGGTLSGIAWKPRRPQADPLLLRWNSTNRPVDFGWISTAGGCRICPLDRGLAVTPLPADRATSFAAEIDWAKLPWKLPRPTECDVLAEDGSLLATIPVAADGERVSLEWADEAFEYRLR